MDFWGYGYDVASDCVYEDCSMQRVIEWTRNQHRRLRLNGILYAVPDQVRVLPIMQTSATTNVYQSTDEAAHAGSWSAQTKNKVRDEGFHVKVKVRWSMSGDEEVDRESWYAQRKIDVVLYRLTLGDVPPMPMANITTDVNGVPTTVSDPTRIDQPNCASVYTSSFCDAAQQVITCAYVKTPIAPLSFFPPCFFFCTCMLSHAGS